MRTALLDGLGLLVLLLLAGAITWGSRRLRQRRARALNTATSAGPQTAATVAQDEFWAGVGAASVEASDGELAFTATFTPWAVAFNERVRAHWAAYPNDHVGHSGAEALYDLYQLTPVKVQQLWLFARNNGLDPRLLLAILAQEGTGSFDTNPENTAYYGGHGPQPNWGLDLTATLRTRIPAKLRLYPYAVQGGFTASWIDYINWYTPIDSAAFMGAAGVYAVDIHWGDGLKTAFLKAAQAVGSCQDDPVAAYGTWLTQHVERLRPQYVKRPFTLCAGVAGGDSRPLLAQSQEYGKPDYPGAYLANGWWWFPAPDRFCWHIEHL